MKVNKKNRQFEEFNKRLLTELQRNPDAPLKFLAMLLKASVTKVSARLKLLREKGYYTSSRVILNPGRFGILTNGYVIIQYDTKNASEVSSYRERINAMEDVGGMYETVSNQINVQIHTTTNDAFARIIADIASIENVTILDSRIYLRKLFPDKGVNMNHHWPGQNPQK